MSELTQKQIETIKVLAEFHLDAEFKDIGGTTFAFYLTDLNKLAEIYRRVLQDLWAEKRSDETINKWTLRLSLKWDRFHTEDVTNDFAQLLAKIITELKLNDKEN